MHIKLAAAIFAASCLPALAQMDSPHLAPQGSISVVRGRAHIREGADGTFIEIDRPGATRQVVGFIPFGDKPTFPELAGIEGRMVEIGGVVVLDGGPIIVMTDPNQLAIAD